ncbi:MAG: TonB-dependent receptor [Acidobacteria bacterium]|nr:TonB-dependent receptor [Acidobacteriota bacterium]
MLFKRISLAAMVTLIVVVLGGPISGQDRDPQLTGVVRDPTSVGIPGVTVTATEQRTKASLVATTAADGTYTLAVPPGSYSVTAMLAGWRRVTQTADVAGGASRSLDFSLQPTLTEEITVTSMKRDETLHNVPFSVAAPTEKLLRDRGVEDIEGVAANVSGFTVQNLGPGQSQVAMRGISAGQIVRDQPGVKEQVASYLDESVVSLSLFTPDIDLFDVSRVEVLRGPQGTLFGAGSLSGTVRYITNQPELGARKGFAEFGGSLVDGGGSGGNAKIGFNVPLGNKTALRVASYYTRLAGYIDAVQPDLSVREDVNTGFRAGVRAAVRFEPNDRLSVVPRLLYQRVNTDGWNRTDTFNILANPFTTTRPAVTLDGRRQFTQLEEKFTDDFVLGDFNLTYRFGDVTLTSITSYVYRDVLVIRDATALTGSITGGSIGLPEPVYTLDAPLDDATKANVWTQELRFSGGGNRVHWIGGGFYSKTDRDYGQNLLVAGFEDLTGIPTRGLRAPKDSLFFSDLGYKLDQFALFGEGTVPVTPRFSLTGGVRFYHFNEEKEQIFDGIFAHNDTGRLVVSQPGKTDANGLAPRLIGTYKVSDDVNFNAQVSRGFRLGGINDPLNIPLCTSQDLVTFGGRETWKDEKVWNYEVGLKSRVLNGNGAFNVAAFYADINDLQATVTAGSCSSRVVFNVPNARSQGIEVEFEAAPTSNFDFAVSGSFTDPELRSTLTSTTPAGVSVVSGIEEGRRLPTVPRLQLAAAATYQWQVRQGSLAYLTGTVQHIGSRFTQVGDEDLGTLSLLTFEANTIGAPLTAVTFSYDPKLPAYSILNLRAGIRRSVWDVAVYLNNVADERALTSLDQERGTRARIGYLTNQPRTFGVSTRFTF